MNERYRELTSHHAAVPSEIRERESVRGKLCQEGWDRLHGREPNYFRVNIWARYLLFDAVKYYAYIAIERKEAILDPQGKAVGHALGSLGFREVEDTRIGKLVRLTIEAASTEAARAIAESASEKLLANPIMETYSVIEVSEEPVLHAAEWEIGG